MTFFDLLKLAGAVLLFAMMVPTIRYLRQELNKLPPKGR